MKFIFTILLAVIFSPLALAEEVILGSVEDPYAKEHKVFKFDSAKIDKLPKWDKDSNDVPLSITEAIRLSKKAAKLDLSDKLSHIQSVIFAPRRLKDGRFLWAYSVSFRLFDVRHYSATSYLVLLDGSVVSPTTE